VEYFNNKGQRSWDTDDRRIIPLADLSQLGTSE
jgi:hypothetical protein